MLMTLPCFCSTITWPEALAIGKLPRTLMPRISSSLPSRGTFRRIDAGHVEQQVQAVELADDVVGATFDPFGIGDVAHPTLMAGRFQVGLGPGADDCPGAGLIHGIGNGLPDSAGSSVDVYHLLLCWQESVDSGFLLLPPA